MWDDDIPVTQAQEKGYDRFLLFVELREMQKVSATNERI